MTSQHNRVLHAFSVPDWSEMCGVVGVLTVFLLLPTQYTAEEIVKMWCQEFDIYLLANIYTYIYRYRYHTLDKRYGFSLSVQPEITSLLRPVFFSMLKKCFSKVGSLWLVGDVVNHVGLYWSKVAEGYSAFQRRSWFFSQWLLMVCCHYSVTDPNLKPIFCVHSSIKPVNVISNAFINDEN